MMFKSDIMWKLKYRVNKADSFEVRYFTVFEEAYEELRYLLEEVQAYSVELVEVQS